MATGPALRAVLRQLSTAAAIRSLPTPCRGRASGAARRPLPGGADLARPGVAHGIVWGRVGGVGGGEGDGAGRGGALDGIAPGGAVEVAAAEAWDLDDGFLLPPPMLELEMVDIPELLPEHLGALAEQHEATDGMALTTADEEEQVFQQLLARSAGVPALKVNEAFMPLASAVLAGGRRFPHARPNARRTTAVPPGGGRFMRWRRAAVRQSGGRRGFIPPRREPRGR